MNTYDRAQALAETLTGYERKSAEVLAQMDKVIARMEERLNKAQAIWR